MYNESTASADASVEAPKHYDMKLAINEYTHANICMHLLQEVGRNTLWTIFATHCLEKAAMAFQ